MASARLEHERPSQIEEDQNLIYYLKKILHHWNLNPGPPTPQSTTLPSMLSQHIEKEKGLTAILCHNTPPGVPHVKMLSY